MKKHVENRNALIRTTSLTVKRLLSLSSLSPQFELNHAYFLGFHFLLGPWQIILKSLQCNPVPVIHESSHAMVSLSRYTSTNYSHAIFQDRVSTFIDAQHIQSPKLPGNSTLKPKWPVN